MKNLFPLFIALFLVLFISCDKNDPVTPNISVKSTASYGDEPLVMNTPYIYPNGMKIKFSRADFLIKGFTLSGNNLGSISTKDTAFLLKFTDSDSTLQKAKEGIVKGFESSTGVYNLLSFGVGVDSFTNKKKPADFIDGGLSDGFYYWQGWKSYIFFKIEGNIDANNDGIYESAFVYHIGTNNLYKTNVLLLKNPTGTLATNEILLNFDIKNLLTAGGDPIDLIKTPTSHNLSDILIAQKLFNNISTAISIK